MDQELAEALNWRSLRWKDGCTYEGLEAQGACESHGVVMWPARRERYEGQVRGSCPHGFGVYRWRDGTLYRGEWYDGHMHGCGVVIWKDDKGVVQAKAGKFFSDDFVGAVMGCSADAAHEAALEADVAAGRARSFETQLARRSITGQTAPMPGQQAPTTTSLKREPAGPWPWSRSSPASKGGEQPRMPVAGVGPMAPSGSGMWAARRPTRMAIRPAGVHDGVRTGARQTQGSATQQRKALEWGSIARLRQLQQGVGRDRPGPSGLTPGAPGGSGAGAGAGSRSGRGPERLGAGRKDAAGADGAGGGAPLHLTPEQQRRLEGLLLTEMLGSGRSLERLRGPARSDQMGGVGGPPSG